MVLGRWLRRGARAPGDGAFVAFLTHSAEVQPVNAGERLFADTASTRLRVLIPAAELARRVPVRLVPLARFLADPSLRALGAPRAVVIAKLAAGAVAAMERELTALLDAVAAGRCPAPVFADLSDDYAALADALRAPFLAEYQRRLAEHCALTVPCAALRDALAPHTGAPAFAADDGRGQLRVFWKAPTAELSIEVFHREVVVGFFGLDEAAVRDGALAFPKAIQEAAREVRAGRGTVALYLNPLRPEDVFRVTAAGATLPQKSTFFYPKLPTGLLFRSLDES